MKSKLQTLLAFVCLTPIAALAEGVTLEHIAEMRRVEETAISPGGERIAYVLSIPRQPGVGEDGPAWRELHVIGPDGESRGYVTGDVSVNQIAWTPDGDAVTFLAQRSGDPHPVLYRIRADGGEAAPLAQLETPIAGYDLSPDGGRAALIAPEPEDPEVAEARGLGFDADIFEEDVTPHRLWIKDLREDDGEPEMLDIDGSVQEALWAPDGELLAIKATPRQLIDDVFMFQRIRIIDAEGAEQGRVENPGKLGAMAWSPGGERLAFIATESIHDPREGRLMVTGRYGGDWEHLLPGLEGHIWHVDWLGPEEIVYVSYEGVETRLGVYDLDADEDATFFQEDGRILGGLSVAHGGRIAFPGESPEHPREVYAFSPDNGAAERLTESNPWLDDARLARQEAVTYEARDGLMIEGLLVWPLDYEEGTRYPLILAVHGGPEMHYSNGWLTEYHLPAQHAAAQGYFMFFPNYRGSTGRGVAFTEMSQARPAAEEFADLVDGVDHLIEEGLVDGERVGVSGSSYGGYATAWCATYYSERFAAGVMNVGLTDKVSMLGTSDIPQELYLVHYLSWPWEDWAMYREASPIYYVERAQTPLLILHGGADPRVDPTQSRILYRYLSLQEDPPPVRLVLYPGEGHGNQRAATRWDYSLRFMRWMDHFLKEDGAETPEARIGYGLENAD